MINLLPPDSKRQIKAGQSNSLLLRYCVVSVVLSVPLLLAIAGVYVLMSSSQKVATEIIEENNAKNALYQETHQKANTFSNDLAISKAIFDKEIRYTDITLKVAQVLPPGIILQTLILDAQAFGQPTTINAFGKSYNDALALKTSLEDSPLFSNVHLQSVTRGESENGYPISIIVNVTISPEIIKS